MGWNNDWWLLWTLVWVERVLEKYKPVCSQWNRTAASLWMIGSWMRTLSHWSSSQSHLPVEALGPDPCASTSFLVRNTLVSLNFEYCRILVLVHVPDVPGQCAWLRECKPANFTLKEPHVGVPHVVVDQGCALWEWLVASGAICPAEQALEELLLGLIASHVRDAELPIGLVRDAFETWIVFTARDWRLGDCSCISSSLPVWVLHCLVHSTDWRMVRSHRSLYRLKAISTVLGTTATRSINCLNFLLLSTEFDELRDAIFGALTFH